MSASTPILHMSATPTAPQVNHDDSVGYNSSRTYKYTVEEMALMEVGRQRYIKRMREKEQETMRLRLGIERPQKRSRGGEWMIDGIKPCNVQSNSTGKGRLESMSKEKERDQVPWEQREQMSILTLLAEKLEPSPVETFAAFLNSSQACLRSPSPPAFEDRLDLVRSSRDPLPRSSEPPQTRRRTDPRSTQSIPRSPPPRSKTTTSRASRVPRSLMPELLTASSTPTTTHTNIPLESCADMLMLFKKPGKNSLCPPRSTTKERRNVMSKVDEIAARHENLTLQRSCPRTPMDTELQQLPSPPDSGGAIQQPTHSESSTIVSELSVRLGSMVTSVTLQNSSSSSPFDFASSSNVFQDTSVFFASTPKHPERVTAAEPNPLILQDAKTENAHIDGDELDDFDSFSPQELEEIANMSLLKGNTKTSFAPSSPPSPEILSTSAETTQKPQLGTPTIPSTRPEKRRSARISKPTRPTGTKPCPSPNSKPKLPSPRSSPSPESDENDDSSQFVPLKVHASRPTPNGLQLLIEWEEYPLDVDFTWESESDLSSSVSEFVKAWWTLKSKTHAKEGKEVAWKGKKVVKREKTTAGKKEVEVEKEEEFLVEKILGRRKYGGVLHYLVKWVGYEAVDERTWEPSESLGESVPDLIERFETRRAERRKGGGKGKGKGKGVGNEKIGIVEA